MSFLLLQTWLLRASWSRESGSAERDGSVGDIYRVLVGGPAVDGHECFAPGGSVRLPQDDCPGDGRHS
jgi:hypothetical protein